MATMKTVPTDASVEAFLAGLAPAQKQADARALCALLGEVSGEPPVMWGDAIVGFGRAPYRYASGRSGEWFLIGFAPRSQGLAVYFPDRLDQHADDLARLGRHKASISCLNVRRLADIDLAVLRGMAEAAVARQRAAG